MTPTKSTAPDGKPLRSLARSRYAGGLVVAIGLTALAMSPMGDASTLLQDSFSDGTREVELTFPPCPEGAIQSQRLEFGLPGDAHVWSTQLMGAVSADSEAERGFVVFSIGDHPVADQTNTTFEERGSHANLFFSPYYWKDITGSLNEYMDKVGRGPAVVDVPLTLSGCGVGGYLTIVVNDLAIVYSPGYGDNSQPVQTAPVPDVYVAAGGAVRDVFDLADYFSDPDGDDLRLILIGYFFDTYENGSLASTQGMDYFIPVEVQIHNGSIFDVVSHDASWRGRLNISVCVNDIPGCDGPQVHGRLFEVHVVDPPGSGVMPPSSGIIAPPRLNSASAGSLLRFRVAGEGALPSDAAVEWRMDGTPVGTGPVLAVRAAAQGSHDLEARVATGGSTFVYRESFAVGPALPPAHVPTTPARPSLLLMSGAAFSLTGAAFANSERGRFKLLYLLMAAVAPARKKASVVDHFVRGQIYQAIRDEPGVHFSELVRRAGVGNGTAVYHLRLLEEAGLVRMVSDGTLTRLYPTDRPLDKRTYELHGRDRETFAAVEQLPGITQKELRSRLKRSASAVSRSVGRLAMLGYVTVDARKDGQKVFPRRDDERPAVDPPGFASE